jgi:outer membrane protein assembly factor BamE (lipoprotein component of BamABCDE complex)
MTFRSFAMLNRSYVVLLALPLLFGGCQPVRDQAAAVHDAQDAGSKVTLGTVQREIRVGMSSADVVSVLGSPNMVTTDEQRREAWVWDKVSTESIGTSSAGGATILLLGVSGGSAVRSTTQRTLTIIVKFDSASRVRDFSYRSSSF